MNHVWYRSTLCLVLLLVAAPLFGQVRLSEHRIAEARTARSNAMAVMAKTLAPKTFDTAENHLKKAEQMESMARRNEADVQKEARAAAAHFRKSIGIARQSLVVLTPVMDARVDARRAKAPTFAADAWEKGEARLKEAILTLEANPGAAGAAARADEARGHFRAAELTAVKNHLLRDARETIRRADRAGAAKFTPKTFDRAGELADDAEKALNEDRYDTDNARILADGAHYEGRHAIYLTNLIRKQMEKGYSPEDRLLDAEIPLQAIGWTFGRYLEFDQGTDQAAAQLIVTIQNYQDSLSAVARDHQSNTMLVSLQRAYIEELEGRLGGVSREASDLKAALLRQQEINARYRKVEALFTGEEAQVYRTGNRILIRLVGLAFPSGKSAIEPRQESLLTKIVTAMNTFTNAAFVVEGHTDAMGGDEINRRLSLERAQAVRQYALGKTGYSGDRVDAYGYGESRPVATNRTPEGRAKNRRIDLVINPSFPYPTE